MKLLAHVLKKIELLEKIAYYFSAICILFLCILMFGDISGRFLFNKSIPGTTEISEYLLVSIAFLSLGYAQLHGAHIGMEAVVLHLPKKLQTGLNFFVAVVVIGFFLIMTIQMGERAFLDWSNQVLLPSTSVRIPVWLTSFIAALGGSLLVFALFAQVIDNLLNVMGLRKE